MLPLFSSISAIKESFNNASVCSGVAATELRTDSKSGSSMSLKCLKNSPVNPSGPDDLFLGHDKMTASTSSVRIRDCNNCHSFSSRRLSYIFLKQNMRFVVAESEPIEGAKYECSSYALLSCVVQCYPFSSCSSVM
jgi:hypothetical protein